MLEKQGSVRRKEETLARKGYAGRDIGRRAVWRDGANIGDSYRSEGF